MTALPFRTTGALTSAEAERFDACEQVIEHGFKTFYEVGTALMEVRDSRLYRATFESFGDYCRERWGMGGRRAYQMIEAARVVTGLADVNNCSPGPATESQARELVGLTPEVAVEVLTTAHEQTYGKPTAAAIRTAREMVTSKSSPDPVDSTPAGSGEQIDPLTGEVTNVAGETRPARPAVDEQEYAARNTAPAPRPPTSNQNRRALTDSIWEAVYDLGKHVDRLERLTQDDRFPRNRQAIADKNSGPLERTASTLARVLAAIQNQSPEG